MNRIRARTRSRTYQHHELSELLPLSFSSVMKAG